jgi:hypothetical protein
MRMPALFCGRLVAKVGDPATGSSRLGRCTRAHVPRQRVLAPMAVGCRVDLSARKTRDAAGSCLPKLSVKA